MDLTLKSPRPQRISTDVEIVPERAGGRQIHAKVYSEDRTRDPLHFESLEAYLAYLQALITGLRKMIELEGTNDESGAHSACDDGTDRGDLQPA